MKFLVAVLLMHVIGQHGYADSACNRVLRIQGVPKVYITETGAKDGNPTGRVDIWISGSVTVSEWLNAYLSRNVNEYLPNGLTRGVQYFPGDIRSPDGKTQRLIKYRMDKRIPIEVDTLRTVWDFGNGSGRIRVMPEEGPFAGGYIDVELREVRTKDFTGIYAHFDLSKMKSTVGQDVQSLFGKLGSIPLFGIPFRLAEATVAGARNLAAYFMASVILNNAALGPVNLSTLIAEGKN